MELRLSEGDGLLRLKNAAACSLQQFPQAELEFERTGAKLRKDALLASCAQLPRVPLCHNDLEPSLNLSVSATGHATAVPGPHPERDRNYCRLSGWEPKPPSIKSFPSSIKFSSRP